MVFRDISPEDTTKYKMFLSKYQRSEDIIMQLWYCLDNAYTYDEAKTHIKAWLNGQTTVKKSVTEKKSVVEVVRRENENNRAN